MAILERRRIKSSEGWPQEADEHYERIRHLGQGSSGSVWMAREKTRKGTGGFRTCTNGGKMVAIKRIHLKSARMEAYAEREISILSKINHPNLIRLERCFDYCAVSETQTIAMSLAHGPNLLNLIDKGGALGIPCSRLISRHLVAAVSYLHVRAVTHRDLKPSNCVLVGANHNDKAIWSDDDHAVKKVASGAWKLVLVDFGFARAISEDDISLHDPNLPPHMRFRYRSLSQLQMRMSAVGTDSYIAPEMFNGIHQKEYETECIAPCVSDYGLQVDAYALGTTLLEVMSGVPSGEDINSFIEKTAQKKKINTNEKGGARIS